MRSLLPHTFHTYLSALLENLCAVAKVISQTESICVYVQNKSRILPLFTCTTDTYLALLIL